MGGLLALATTRLNKKKLPTPKVPEDESFIVAGGAMRDFDQFGLRPKQRDSKNGK